MSAHGESVAMAVAMTRQFERVWRCFVFGVAESAGVVCDKC